MAPCIPSISHVTPIPKKATSTTASEPIRHQHVERLTDAIERLADEVRVVRDVLDDIREDLNWITRNGIPNHPIQHTRVVRMALDPLAPDARDHLEVRTYTLEPKCSSAVTPQVLDELVSEIAEAMTVVGQEQLNMLLMALDDARTKLMAAIKNPVGTSMEEKTIPIPIREGSSSSSETMAPTESRERGRLF